jgi:hypothetical protein
MFQTLIAQGWGRAFVSGRKKYAMKNAAKFQQAYHAKAPWGRKALTKAGHVRLRMKLKPQQVAVAKLIPMSRMYSGKASAE